MNSSTDLSANLLFSVRDTGVGIPQSKQDLIFKDFYQIKQLEKDSVGTGLGLAICKRLVELMDGKIGVESTPGEGCDFYFSIPLEKSDSIQQDVVEKLETENFAKKYPLKILIAEDHEANRMVAIDTFAILGYEIDVVSNGQQAVNAAISSDYDLILVDIHMPVMDGLEATSRIREHFPPESCPLVAGLTAEVFDENTNYLAENGWDDLLYKPVTLDNLRHTLKRCYDKKIHRETIISDKKLA